MNRSLLLFVVVAFCGIVVGADAGFTQDELESLISENEKKSSGSGLDAEQARNVLPQLYAIRQRLHKAENNTRHSLTAGRDQLREFMKSAAINVLTKAQKEEICRFSAALDDVIAGKGKIEVLLENDSVKGEALPLIALRGFELRRGDLLLVRNRGIWSRFLIGASQRENRFSHVDIVITPHNVVSVDVDEHTGKGVVRACAIESCAEEFAVYRYSGPDAEKVRERIARAAEKRIGTPFDPAFDLKTKDRLYCTEMVRDCVNEAAGREVIGTSRKGDFEYVAVDDCYRNEMTKVWDCRDQKPEEKQTIQKLQSRPVVIENASTTNAPVRRTIRFIPKNR